MIQFICSIDIIYVYTLNINCYEYVDKVRLTVAFNNIWWISQYTCELQELVNDIM